MKCTVLLVFSCAFTVFSLQKHVHLIHFACVCQNSHVSYILHEMHSFASVFMCFHCVFTAETWTFIRFTWIYQNTHVPYILHEMHCFASVFTSETSTFDTFHLYTKIHMFHIFDMKCTVLLVFSCVFTAETCTFGTFLLYTKIHM
jgi:hypothetical protein